jgi:hypothetical protein
VPLEHCSPERLDGIYEVELDSFKKKIYIVLTYLNSFVHFVMKIHIYILKIIKFWDISLLV